MHWYQCDISPYLNRGHNELFESRHVVPYSTNPSKRELFKCGSPVSTVHQQQQEENIWMWNDLMNFLRVAKITAASPVAEKFDFSLQLMLVMTVTVQRSPPPVVGFCCPSNLHKIIKFNFNHHPATHQTQWARLVFCVGADLITRRNFTICRVGHIDPTARTIFDLLLFLGQMS